MTESHSCPLSEPVSAQPHGVVLHWQGYSAGSGVANAQHNYFFIPRSHAALSGGIGLLLQVNKDLVWKYIYVRDDEVSGYASNDSKSFEFSGLTLDNTRAVLTEVLGV